MRQDRVVNPDVGALAVEYAAEHYPLADLIVVGGSAARTRRPGSDIDLLVVGPAAMFAVGADEAAYTHRWSGELFEVFAATPAAFRRHQAAGVARYRPVSGFLLTDGVVVVDRGVSDTLIAETRTMLAAGPAPTPAELAQRRYAVTTTLDDLLDAADSAEVAVLAGLLFQRLAEFLLLASGQWMASGRWLLIRLRELDAEFADALGAALVARDRTALEALTLQALTPYGGRLMDGHVH